MVYLKWYSIVAITLFNFSGIYLLIFKDREEYGLGLLVLLPIMLYLWSLILP